jgi:protein-S-isoprenylcysteine O-methyltransferase Ste14
MQADTVAAAILFTCLTCFFTVNLYNILIVHKRRPKDAKIYAEVEGPSGFAVNVAGLGTLIYFLEALSYVFLALTNIVPVPYYFPLTLESPYTIYLQTFGLILTVTGYAVFIWSVLARGVYAVSWRMPETQKLVTWGPYHYVRHPSYLAYFLMFLGLTLTWPNLFTLLPLLAIPGYYKVTLKEEKLLTSRFGQEYTEYQKRTGRFIPN